MANRKKQRTSAMPGLLDMSDIKKLTIMDDGFSDDSDDGDLEAELDAIVSGKGVSPKKPKMSREPVDLGMIQKMATECMQSDESDIDENLSGDEDLMAELDNMIATSPMPAPPARRPAAPVPPHVLSKPGAPIHVDNEPVNIITSSGKATITVNNLQGRLQNYIEAEIATKNIGDTSKARRYGRAVKTLETLIRECSSGREINEDDIPPPVTIPSYKQPQPIPVQPNVSDQSVSPTNPPTGEPDTPPRPVMERQISSRRISMKEAKTENTNAMLTTRRDQYKVAALNAKKSGDLPSAMNYFKIAKQFDAVIEALVKGQPIDLSKMPPPPPKSFLGSSPPKIQPKPVTVIPVKSTDPSPTESSVITQEKLTEINLEELVGNEKDAQGLFDAPAAPTTVLEALEQRLEKYRSTQKAAVTENNASKAKRLGRIIKQYEDAIKNYKLGKPVDFESLPVPPGFGTIPGVGETVPSAASQGKPAPANKPVPKPGTTGDQQTKSAVQSNPSALSPQPSVKPASRSPSSLLDKQLNFLNERHRLFREAALESKKNGDMEQAKEYLRMAKGIEPMIEATKSGLPIDATSIPTPPQLKEDFIVVDKSECLDEDWGGDKHEMFRTLERDLTKQFEICIRNKNHFLKLGDVSSSNKFEKLGMNTKQDLNVVQNLWKKGESLPKFHYETRVFSMVQCHSELSDNEVEVKILRGINLPGKPKELDSFVKVEFPFPTEAPQHAKSHTIKDTNVPEFNFAVKFEINRKSKSLARVLKRHNMKVEVWSKGGLFRSDSLLGTAQIKLLDFETKCTIHDSFDLMEGRKSCGGKLEVMTCIRDPLLAKQVEEVKERWLVIGS